MDETKKAVAFVGGNELLKLPNGDLMQHEWYVVATRQWYADLRSDDPTWHVRSISPRQVYAFRYTS